MTAKRLLGSRTARPAWRIGRHKALVLTYPSPKSLKVAFVSAWSPGKGGQWARSQQNENMSVVQNVSR